MKNIFTDFFISVIARERQRARQSRKFRTGLLRFARNDDNFLKICLCCVLVCISSVGCISAKKFTPNQYQLEIPKPFGVRHKTASKVLEINNVTIVPQFASLGFVYRTSELSYLTDYYNTFFTPQAAQINKIMIDYLRDKNIFSYVANDAGQLKINYILYPQITALYADYRNSKRPLGVIAIDFVLFSANKSNRPLLHKQYSVQTPLAAKNSESLVKAWNKGLQKILFDFSNDLMRLA
jgi:ABC-type uncharacterized transport system auxiliary subunit